MKPWPGSFVNKELGFKEAQRCLNCDVQTVFTTQLCIECDACVDICPMDCISFTQNGEEAELRGRSSKGVLTDIMERTPLDLGKVEKS